MDIILLIDYDGLGTAGDLVSVKSGFARNKLIPQGVALRATKQNIAVVEERKITKEKLKNREVASNQALLKKLSKTEITIEAQAGEEDKMFGSITAHDIQKSLENEGVAVDRNAILLENPIKSLGIFHVTIRIAEDCEADVKIYVIKS